MEVGRYLEIFVHSPSLLITALQLLYLPVSKMKVDPEINLKASNRQVYMTHLAGNSRKKSSSSLFPVPSRFCQILGGDRTKGIGLEI